MIWQAAAFPIMGDGKTDDAIYDEQHHDLRALLDRMADAIGADVKGLHMLVDAEATPSYDVRIEVLA